MSLPGPLVLLGSGETAHNMQRVYTWLFRPFAAPVRVAILETPAGFEPNSAQVAGRLGTYLEQHLVNFRPQVTMVPARRKDGDFSTDNAELLAPLGATDVIMTGPGSPTYAVRHLRDSRAWQMIRAHHRLGGGLLFSSAGTLAAGAQTLPVYEIYKVGEELHWQAGLNLLGDYGLDVILISHWNNNDGGDALDTSRCYMGRERFARLLELLSNERANSQTRTLIGIDEKTALCLDFELQSCTVLGAGGVVILRDGQESRFARGLTFPMTELGRPHLPEGNTGLDAEIWRSMVSGRATRSAEESAVAPDDVSALVALREVARLARDWGESDRLRNAISALGWQVNDTPVGPLVERMATA